MHSVDVVHFRQEVFADLEDDQLRNRLESFATEMLRVRRHLEQIERMSYRHQREGWFLEAARRARAAIYCRAVRTLADDLTAGLLRSRGLRSFRDFLTTYVASDEFTVLDADTDAPL